MIRKGYRPAKEVIFIYRPKHRRLRLISAACDMPVYQVANLALEPGMREIKKRYTTIADLKEAVQEYNPPPDT